MRSYFPAFRLALSGQNALKLYDHILGYANKISNHSDSQIINPKNRKVASHGYSLRMIDKDLTPTKLLWVDLDPPSLKLRRAGMTQ